MSNINILHLFSILLYLKQIKFMREKFLVETNTFSYDTKNSPTSH